MFQHRERSLKRGGKKRKALFLCGPVPSYLVSQNLPAFDKPERGQDRTHTLFLPGITSGQIFLERLPTSEAVLLLHKSRYQDQLLTEVI